MEPGGTRSRDGSLPLDPPKGLRGLLPALAFLGLLLLLVAGGASASVDASEAPWWGPSDPEEPEEGFHFRVPVLVENPHDYPLQDPVAFAELDLGQALIDAGWNARSLGSVSFPTSFTLDADSVRVVPYERGFTAVAAQEPEPSRFYEGRFSEEAEGAFDASRNPVGTVAFLVEGTLAPGEARAFVVYFTSQQQGDRAPEAAPARVDGWPASGWGTVSYGFPMVEAVGASPAVDVLAAHEGTTVEVFTYEGGQPQPARLPDLGNPFTLGADQSVSFEPPPRTFYKVEASKPVLVADRGEFSSSLETFGGGGFVPAESGLASGTRFHFPAYTPEVVVSLAELGSTDVTVQVDGDTQSVSLGTASPSSTIELPASASSQNVPVASLTSSELPVLVQYGAPLMGVHGAPSAIGATAGEDVRTLAPDGTRIVVASEEPTGVRVLEGTGSSQQLVPFGDVSEAPPHELDAFPDELRVQTNESFPEEEPVRVVSTGVDEAPAHPVHVSVGSDARAGAFLPGAGLSAFVEGGFAVAGAFDGTRVTYQTFPPGSEPTEEERTVNEDGVLAFEAPPPGTTARVTLSKPGTILPTDPLDRYARVLPGHGPGTDVPAGGLEFRGGLVELDVEEAVGGQAVDTVGPGQSLSFHATVKNVGHWTDGESIAEEVTLECSGAGPSWTVDGCGESFTLVSGQSESVELEITASEDVSPGDRLSLSLEAKGERWNTTDTSEIVLLVRTVYGVDAWFHAEGGPTDLRDAPVFVDRGEEDVLPVIVKNTGTVEDTYRVELLAPSEGWSLEARQDGEAVDAVELEAEETTRLDVRVRSSEDPRVHSTPVDLEVASTSDELTFARVQARAQIATDLNVSVDAPEPVALLEPGTQHAYELNVTNQGDSIVNVDLNATPSVPEGWRVDVPVSSLSLFPDNSTTLEVTVATPGDAPAGQRGTVSALVSAARNPGEQPTETRRILTGLVEHVHDLEGPRDPIPVDAGIGAEVTVPLHNRGNANETVRVLGTSPSLPFQTPGPVEVPANDTGSLPLRLDVPAQAPPGPFNVSLHLDLSRDVQTNLTLPLDVRETPRLEAQITELRPLMPGKTTTLPATLTSAGNVPLEGTPTLQAPGDWTVNATPGSVNLGPGESANVTYAVTAPEQGRPETVPLTPQVELQDGETVASEATPLPVGEVDLELSNVHVESLEEDDLLVRTTLANNGPAAAHDATVALVNGEDTLDSTTVQRLQPDERATVSLSSTEAEHDGLRLVADPQHELADRDRSTNEVALDDSQALVPAPFATPSLVLAAWALRRWRP